MPHGVEILAGTREQLWASLRAGVDLEEAAASLGVSYEAARLGRGRGDRLPGDAGFLPLTTGFLPWAGADLHGRYVDRDGNVLDRFGPTTTPEEFTPEVEKALAAE